jgi:regulator of sigma E protease
VPDILLFVIILGSLILVHELGHFIAAKLTGVKVEEFGIGFPPRIGRLFTLGGTEFTLNWVPLGGFVRPAGEDDPDVPGGLASSPKRVRTAVLLAGPAANILFALLVYLFAFKFAAPDLNRVAVAEVQPDTPAAAAGLLEGDIIQSIDGVTIDGFQSLHTTIQDRLDQTATVVLVRGEEILSVELTPRSDYPANQGPMGITISNPTRTSTWLEAGNLSLEAIKNQFVFMAQLPGRILSGEASSEEARVSGLKGIHDMVAWANDIDQSSGRPPYLTLSITGMISVGLALANLLPFPALDGGRLMFVAYEAVFRRRVPPQYEGLAHAIGFVVLIALMVYFNLQDFINPITLP